MNASSAGLGHTSAGHLPARDQVDTVSLYADAGTATGHPASEESDEPPGSAKPVEENLQLVGQATRRSFRGSAVAAFHPGSGGRAALLWHVLQCLSCQLLATLDHVARHPAGGRDRQAHGSVTVYKSNARGPFSGWTARRSTATAGRVPASIEPFGDGGWYWFDLASGTGDLVLKEAPNGRDRRHLRAGEQVTSKSPPWTSRTSAWPTPRILADNPEAPWTRQGKSLIVDQGTRKVVAERRLR